MLSERSRKNPSHLGSMNTKERQKLDNVSGNNTATRLILPSTTFPSIELPDILPQGLLLRLQ